MSFAKYARVARSASQMAAKYLMERFGDVKSMAEKEESHWSAAEDKECNELYREYLVSQTPEVSRYLEEGERNISDNLTWVVDPIEGTSNFSAGIPFFATQICLLSAGQPVISVVNAPYLSMEFVAVSGKGATMNNRVLKVSDQRLKHAFVSVDKGHGVSRAIRLTEIFTNHARSVRMFGAAGLNFAFVASGGIDLMINKGSDLYDLAPGILLVREAGGKVCNFSGNEWQFSDKEAVAGNPQIVDEALEALKGFY